MGNLANRKISRRQFITSTAGAAAAFSIVPSHVLGRSGNVAPSERLNIAVVGCGGQGRNNIRGLMGHKDVRIVAIADPTESADYKQFYYRGIAGRSPVKKLIEKKYQATDPNFTCNAYNDFRVLFDKEKNIDAVLCATPDHWHAYVTIMAMKHGKNVYCEKPLAHNIWEVRQVAKVAAEMKVATQMGNQGRSASGHPMMREWLADGAIGKVSEVQAWSNVGGHIHHKGRPTEAMEIPKGMDWKMWVGPRGMRPYSQEYCPYTWRNWWAFGSGIMGDMSIHHFDSAWMQLNPGQPSWIEGKTENLDGETTSENNTVTWMFDKTSKRDALKFSWCDGAVNPDRPEELEEKRKMGGNGVLVTGDKGKILGGGWSGSPRIIPEVKMKEYKRPAETLTRSKGHHRNWLDACKNGGETVSNFAYAAKLTEFVLLGNLAIRAGKRIYWDAENMKVKGMPEMDSIIREKYVPEWDLQKLL
jgi:predicted dehydrogenase